MSGLFNSILQVAVRNVTALLAREPPWAFNNSANALEDVLGLTAALVVSRINSSTVAINATSVVTTTRIGTGSLYSLVFTIPPAIAFLVLISLLRFLSPTHSDSAVVSSSMISLINLGRNGNRESTDHLLNQLSWRDDRDDRLIETHAELA